MNPKKLLISIFICIIFAITTIGGCINIQDPPQNECNWVNGKIKCIYVELQYPDTYSFNFIDPYIYSFANLFESSDYTYSEAQIHVSVSSETCIGNTNESIIINRDNYFSHITEDDYTIDNISFINNINPKELSLNISFKINNILEYNSLKEGDIVWNLSTDGYSAGYVLNTTTNTFDISYIKLKGIFTPNLSQLTHVYSAGQYIRFQ